MEELQDIFVIFLQALSTDTSKDKEGLLNGVIHECDRMLRHYDPMRQEREPGMLPIDCPLFYNIYSHALYELWCIHYKNIWGDASSDDLSESEGFITDDESADESTTNYLPTQDMLLLIQLSKTHLKAAKRWMDQTSPAAKPSFQLGPAFIESIQTALVGTGAQDISCETDGIKNILDSMQDPIILEIELLRIYCLYLVHKVLHLLSENNDNEDMPFDWIKRKFSVARSYSETISQLISSRKHSKYQDYKSTINEDY